MNFGLFCLISGPPEGEILIRLSTISINPGDPRPIWVLGGLFSAFFATFWPIWPHFWPPGRRNVNPTFHDLRISRRFKAHLGILGVIFSLFHDFLAYLASFLAPQEEKMLIRPSTISANPEDLRPIWAFLGLFKYIYILFLFGCLS